MKRENADFKNSPLLYDTNNDPSGKAIIRKHNIKVLIKNECASIFGVALFIAVHYAYLDDVSLYAIIGFSFLSIYFMIVYIIFERTFFRKGVQIYTDKLVHMGKIHLFKEIAIIYWGTHYVRIVPMQKRYGRTWDFSLSVESFGNQEKAKNAFRKANMGIIEI